MSDDVAPATAARMLPSLDEHNRSYWTGGSDGRLLINRCESCGRWTSPPAADCPVCDGPLTPAPVSGRATVFTYTVNHQPFNPAVPVPYVIAIVELEEQPGLRLAANIVDCEPDSVRVGLPVEVAFERQRHEGQDVYVPVFTPRRD